MFESLSMPLVFGAFALAALVVLVLGTKMAGLADRIADSTGLGEAVTGGLLLGAATSLSGTVVSLTAALDGRAGLAFSNGIGGIAAQTAFLALADTVYRKANLEHSAADVTNVFQAALLSLMLVVPLGAVLTPDMSFWAVHPASVVLLVIYLAKLPPSPLPLTPAPVPPSLPSSTTGLVPLEGAPPHALLAHRLAVS